MGPSTRPPPGIEGLPDAAKRERFMAAYEGQAPWETGGTYYMFTFSDEETGEGGPRRVSKGDIHLFFAKGWQVRSIERAHFEAYCPLGGAKAWFVAIQRVP